MFSVRAIIVRSMCYHRMSLYDFSSAYVFMLPWAMPVAGQALLLQFHLLADILPSLVSLQC